MAKSLTHDGVAELQSAVWVLHGTIDPIKTLAACASTPSLDDDFCVRIRSGTRCAPLEARFRFLPDTYDDRMLAFAWTRDGDAPLPSMQGTLSARRIGPLLILRVHAQYACGLDAPERLFFEAVGRKLAHHTFKALLRALVQLLQRRPPRALDQE
jgi:hypothetical protein